jgi:hypothetical protein
MPGDLVQITSGNFCGIDGTVCDSPSDLPGGPLILALDESDDVIAVAANFAGRLVTLRVPTSMLRLRHW